MIDTTQFLPVAVLLLVIAVWKLQQFYQNPVDKTLLIVVGGLVCQGLGFLLTYYAVAAASALVLGGKPLVYGLVGWTLIRVSQYAIIFFFIYASRIAGLGRTALRWSVVPLVAWFIIAVIAVVRSSAGDVPFHFLGHPAVIAFFLAEKPFHLTVYSILVYVAVRYSRLLHGAARRGIRIVVAAAVVIMVGEMGYAGLLVAFATAQQLSQTWVAVILAVNETGWVLLALGFAWFGITMRVRALAFAAAMFKDIVTLHYLRRRLLIWRAPSPIDARWWQVLTSPVSVISEWRHVVVIDIRDALVLFSPYVDTVAAETIGGYCAELRRLTASGQRPQFCGNAVRAPVDTVAAWHQDVTFLVQLGRAFRAAGGQQLRSGA